MSKSTCQVVVRNGIIAEHGNCLLCVECQADPNQPETVMEVWMARTVTTVYNCPVQDHDELVPAIRVERGAVRLSGGDRMDAGQMCDGKLCDSCKCSVYPDTQASRHLLERLRHMHGEMNILARAAAAD